MPDDHDYSKHRNRELLRRAQTDDPRIVERVFDVEWRNKFISVMLEGHFPDLEYVLECATGNESFDVWLTEADAQIVQLRRIGPKGDMKEILDEGAWAKLNIDRALLLAGWSQAERTSACVREVPCFARAVAATTKGKSSDSRGGAND